MASTGLTLVGLVTLCMGLWSCQGAPGPEPDLLDTLVDVAQPVLGLIPNIPPPSALTSCDTFLGGLGIEFFDTFCPFGCDAHCVCLHGAKYGACVDWPRNMTKLTIPTLLNMPLCTCDYLGARPADLPSVSSTEECKTFFHVHPKLSETACNKTLGAVQTACTNDCVCAHGFTSGNCEEDLCKCEGWGPLNWTQQP